MVYPDIFHFCSRITWGFVLQKVVLEHIHHIFIRLLEQASLNGLWQRQGVSSSWLRQGQLGQSPFLLVTPVFSETFRLLPPPPPGINVVLIMCIRPRSGQTPGLMVGKGLPDVHHGNLHIASYPIVIQSYSTVIPSFDIYLKVIWGFLLLICVLHIQHPNK